jgi:hypothetical protein
MLNPESVMLNLFQHLFRAGLFQHKNKLNELRDPETSLHLNISQNFKPYDIIKTKVIVIKLEEAKILHQGEWISLGPLREKGGGL